jgi:uncharacterized membrane protein YfcA
VARTTGVFPVSSRVYRGDATGVNLALDAILGALLGGLGGLFGIGGGLIAIPVLVLLYGYDQQHAQGTALVMIVPNVLLGLWRYRSYGELDGRMAVVLGLSAVAFTFALARYATRVDAQALRFDFAVFVLATAAYMVWRSFANPTSRVALAWYWSAFVGAAGGALSGLFGVGGATVAPPLLVTFFGQKQTAAQGLALALVAPGSIVALVAYAAAGDVVWPTGLALGAGGLLTVSAGVSLAHRMPEKRMRLLFSGFLVATAIVLFFH